jgi:phosphate transport system substrate-binding protein
VLGSLATGLAVVMTACAASNEGSNDDPSTPTGSESTTASGGSGNTSGDLSGTLNGAGSTAQEAAMGAWKAGFQTANSGVTVNYDAVGSGGGRDSFLSGAVNFAGSDAYLSDDELAQAKTQCGSDPVEIPVYVSPIAVIYHLDGVDSLTLTPATLADIFAGKITQWNDPAIADENPGASLPDTDITPVHRSDDSGTTQNFTDYLARAAPDDWIDPASQTWPIQGGQAGDGTAGVVAAVKAGAGAIGYADASQAGDLGIADIQVGSDAVAPSADAASKVLDESAVVSGRPATDLAIAVNRTTTTAGVYPIILISYQMVCQVQKDQATADLIKAFERYVVSAAGQQAAASAAGSAPLSTDLATKAQAAIDTITAK